MPHNIAVLGLGNLGHAIAQQFVFGGATVQGWNRSPRDYADRHYRLVNCASECVANANILFIVTSDYSAASEVMALRSDTSLEGKLVIVASSGVPAEAELFAAEIASAGGRYLDCAVIGYPGDFGTERIYFLYAGSRDVFDQYADILKHMGSNQIHVGDAPGNAKAIDCGLLARSYGWIFSYFQALMLMRSLGVDGNQFAGLVSEITGPVLQNILKSTLAIGEGSFEPAEQASINVHQAALQRIIDLATEKKLDLSILQVGLNAMNASIAEGRGGSDMGAVFPSFSSQCRLGRPKH